jgi:creatinine amidohydrolase
MTRPRALARLTEPEVAAHLAAGALVLVPVGSTEQHGPHGPLGTDAILAEEVCRRVAPRVNALVAPPIAFGVSPEHEGFAGLISLAPTTLIALVRDVCCSLARGGFRRIVLVNGHYTNVVALHAAIIETTPLVPDGTRLCWLNYWDALDSGERDAYLGAEAGLHANIGETSATLAVDPSLVRLDAAVAETPAVPDAISDAALFAYLFTGGGSLRRVLSTGVWGDPRESTAERGEQYLGQIERALERMLGELEALFEKYGAPRGA